MLAALPPQLILLTPMSKEKENQSSEVSQNLQMFTVYSVGPYKKLTKI